MEWRKSSRRSNCFLTFRPTVREELAEAYDAYKFGFPVFGNFSVLVSFTFWTVSKEEERRRGSRGDNYRSGSERRKATFSAAVVIAKTRTDFVQSLAAEREKTGKNKEGERGPTPIRKFTDEKNEWKYFFLSHMRASPHVETTVVKNEMEEVERRLYSDATATSSYPEYNFGSDNFLSFLSHS